MEPSIALMAEFDGMLVYRPEECGFESHLGHGEKFLEIFCKNIFVEFSTV